MRANLNSFPLSIQRPWPHLSKNSESDLRPSSQRHRHHSASIHSLGFSTSSSGSGCTFSSLIFRIRHKIPPKMHLTNATVLFPPDASLSRQLFASGGLSFHCAGCCQRAIVERRCVPVLPLSRSPFCMTSLVLMRATGLPEIQ